VADTRQTAQLADLSPDARHTLLPSSCVWPPPFLFFTAILVLSPSFYFPFVSYLSPATMRLRAPISNRQRKHDRFVQAVEQVRDGFSIRLAMETVNFGAPGNECSTVGSIHRELHRVTVSTARVGQPSDLTEAQEAALCKTITDFQVRGFSITKVHLIEAVTDVIAELPAEEKNKRVGGRPSDAWMRRFCSRNDLNFRHENRVEGARAKATTKASYAQHFAILDHLVKTQNITADRISNWDDSGFFLGTMATGMHKVLVNPKAGRSLSRSLSVTKASENITVGAAVTASWRAFAPIFVLPGAEAKYRDLADGAVETPANY